MLDACSEGEYPLADSSPDALWNVSAVVFEGKLAFGAVVLLVTESLWVRRPADSTRSARYAYGPAPFPQAGVPRGTVFLHVDECGRIFPATGRRYWIYVPAGYSEWPAALMIFRAGTRRWTVMAICARRSCLTT